MNLPPIKPWLSAEEIQRIRDIGKAEMTPHERMLAAKEAYHAATVELALHTCRRAICTTVV